MDATRVGQAGLTGWRRPLSERVARAIARRTPLTSEAVLGLLGALSMALAVRRLVTMGRTLRRELRS